MQKRKSEVGRTGKANRIWIISSLVPAVVLLVVLILLGLRIAVADR